MYNLYNYVTEHTCEYQLLPGAPGAREHLIIRVYHKVRPKGYQSAQLGSRNHCKLNSGLLLQTKVMAGTLEREQ